MLVTVSLIPFLLLALAGALHLRNRGDLIATLSRYIPGRTAATVLAAAVTALELCLGISGASATVLAAWGGPEVSAILPAVTAAMYGCFGCFLVVESLQGSPVPCACFGSGKTVGHYEIVRAFAMAPLSLVATHSGIGGCCGGPSVLGATAMAASIAALLAFGPALVLGDRRRLAP